MKNKVGGCSLPVPGAVSLCRHVARQGATRRTPISSILGLLFVSLLAMPLGAQNIDNATVKSIDASAGVAAAIRTIGSTEPAWFAWTAPIRGRSICCWQGGAGRNGCCGRCRLEGGHGFSIGDSDDDDGPITRSEMLLAVRVEQGKVRKVRMFSASCAVDGQGKTIHLLTNVTADQSLDYFLSQIRQADREGEMLAAVSMHEHPRVVPELIRLARYDEDRETRRHAIFWLGQKAGEKAAGELRRFVDEDPDTDVKTHAVFAIAQLPPERSVPMLIELVKTHKNREVREKAMFWLAQTGDSRAVDLMEEILLR